MGSNQTIRVDVRVVAATNQDLSQLVANKQFRADLYYRLNVIPISLPPLRERVEDIPLLVNYFVKKISARLDKPIDAIPAQVMEMFKGHDWPGNIRELQNNIERAVVLPPGSVLRPMFTELKHMTKQSSEAANRLADRRDAWRRRTARLAAHYPRLQNAETRNRNTPFRAWAVRPNPDARARARYRRRPWAQTV